MHGTPSRIAIVAGTAPFSLTMTSNSFAVSKFWGYGIPGSSQKKGIIKTISIEHKWESSFNTLRLTNLIQVRLN